MTEETPSTADTKRAWPALIVLAVFAAISLAAMVLPFDSGAQILDFLHHVKESPVAAPAAILAFAALASIGAPQVVLIPALVVVFGPWLALLYAWIGKMIHCSAGFFVGRYFGAGLLRKHAGPKLTLVMEQLAKRGFLASAAIRLVPTVPSVVVNVAAGCTPMRYLDFIAGAGVGSIPKMTLIAFAGDAAMRGMSGGGIGAWLTLAAALVLLILIAVIGRESVKRLSEK